MQVGPYRVEGELGRGGMGVVYRAHDPGLDRPVALKVLSVAGAGPEDVLRFRREALAMARLRHPGIVGVHAVGQTPQGLPYLVMDLVEGESLAARLARDGPLAEAEALRWFEGAARALAHAHARGVLHRDLKPHNLLVDRDGLVLTDFGLAAVLTAETRLTRSGDALGTPAYMAPEQVTGDRARLGPATDTYGLAATLYHALTGQPPFRGPSALEVLDLVATRAPARPSSLRPVLDPRLDALLHRALAKDPAARFPTAEALADALAALTPARRAPPAPARRAAFAAAGLAVGAALGAVLAGRAPVPAAPPGPPPPATDAPPALAPPAPAPPAPAPTGAARLADARRVATLLAAGDARRADAGAAARALLDGLLADDPADLAALLARAELRLEARDPAGARADAARALEVAPGCGRALALRALARLDVEDRAGAVEDAEAAVAADPEDVDARLARAEALATRGGADDAARAAEDVHRAIELAPLRPAPLVLAGRAEAAIGRQPSAADLYRRAVAVAPWATNARLLLAATLADAGRHEEAEAEARVATALTPRDPRAHLILASVALARRRLPEARAAVDDALALAPGAPVALGLRAQVAVLDGVATDEDLAALRRGADDARGPGRGEALAWYALALYLRADPRASAAATARALAADPDEPLALTLEAEGLPPERAADARRLVERALGGRGALLPEAWRCRARLRHAAHDLAGARADYDRALALAPRDQGSLRGRAAVRRDQGDGEGALLDLAAALTALPAAPGPPTPRLRDAAQLVVHLACDLAGVERLLLAAEHAARLEPADAEDLLAGFGEGHGLARALRSRARLAVGDVPGAVAHAEAAVATAPRFASVHLALSAALRRAGRTAEAGRAAARAIELAPDLPQARALAAAAALDEGDMEAVLEHLRAGLDGPGGALLAPLQASLLAGTDRLDDALRIAGEALARQPSVAAAEVRARALARLGRAEEARRALDDVWRAVPAAAAPLIVEAEVQTAAGRRPEAIAAAERALAVDPTSVDAAVALVRLLEPEPARALAAAERAVAIVACPITRVMRAHARRAAGDLEGARADLVAVRDALPPGRRLRRDAEALLAELGR